MYLSQNIELLCQQRRLSQKEAWKECGISTTKVELLTPSELVLLADYFGYSVDALLRKDLDFGHKAAKADIKLLILDIDGVMTDAGMYFTEKGDQIKKYNAKDGMAIIHLTSNDFQVGVISSGFTDHMVRQRVELLQIQRFHVGRNPKMEVLEEWLEEMNITLQNVAFIGDDINDQPIMEQCGLAVCPNDAVPAIQDISDIILSHKGGKGCVREYIDNYLLPNINL